MGQDSPMSDIQKPSFILPLKIRQSEEALWLEDAAGHRPLYSYFERDPGMRSIRNRISYEDALASMKIAARALTDRLSVKDVES